MDRFLKEDTSVEKECDQGDQERFHLEARTHPGEGWRWLENRLTSERKKHQAIHGRLYGKPNILFLSKAFYADGTLAPVKWGSWWVK